MNTAPLVVRNRDHTHTRSRACDPAAAFHHVIGSLGSATPWAMLAFSAMSPHSIFRNNTTTPVTKTETMALHPKSKIPAC